MNKKEKKQKLIEIIEMKSYKMEDEVWIPTGKEGEHCVIEEKNLFFWRINPKWAEYIAEKILEEFKKVVK
jgi:hypothetical protein